MNSVIKCTDCHNTDAFESTTGRAPTTGATPDTPGGPHGSVYPSILRANFWSTLPGPDTWNPANFNLCFRCHASGQLMGGSTNFDDQIDGRDNLHEVHLDHRSDKAQAICMSCHYNIHSNVEAPNTQYNIDGVVTNTPPDGIPTRLVNFHPNIVGIGGRPRPEWGFNTSTKERRCYLECHSIGGGVGGGEVMNGLPYRPASGDIP